MQSGIRRPALRGRTIRPPMRPGIWSPSAPRPGSYALSSKWIELLKEIAPGVTQAAVLRDPSNPSGIGQFAAIQMVAPSLGIDLRTIDMRNAATLERIIAAFAQSSGHGLIVTSAGSVVRSDLTLIVSSRAPMLIDQVGTPYEIRPPPATNSLNG
jgi:hypothetical protein